MPDGFEVPESWDDEYEPSNFMVALEKYQDRFNKRYPGENIDYTLFFKSSLINFLKSVSDEDGVTFMISSNNRPNMTMFIYVDLPSSQAKKVGAKYYRGLKKNYDYQMWGVLGGSKPLHEMDLVVGTNDGEITLVKPPKRIATLERKAGPRDRKANNIAATIVNQLGGGRKLQMMIGLKQLINEPNGVTLVFPKPKHRGAVNRVRITLNGLDLYDMEFIRTHGRSVKVVKEFNDVYAEDLKDRFEDGTGLYIRF